MPCDCNFYKQDKKGDWICDAGDYGGNRCPILHGYKLGLKVASGRFRDEFLSKAEEIDLTCDDEVYCVVMDIIEKIQTRGNNGKSQGDAVRDDQGNDGNIAEQTDKSAIGGKA